MVGICFWFFLLTLLSIKVISRKNSIEKNKGTLSERTVVFSNRKVNRLYLVLLICISVALATFFCFESVGRENSFFILQQNY